MGIASADGSLELSWDSGQSDVTNSTWTVVIGGSGYSCTTPANTAPPFIVQYDDVTVTDENGTQHITLSIEPGEANLVPGTSYRFSVVETCAFIVTDEDNPNTTNCALSPEPFNVPDTPFTVTADPTSPTCEGGDDGSLLIAISDGSCTGSYTITLNTGDGTFIESITAMPAGSYVFSGREAGTYEVVVTETSGCLLTPADNPESVDVSIEEPASEPPAVLSVLDLLGNGIADSGDDITLPEVILPEGVCSEQLGLLVFGFTPCDGLLTAPDAITVSAEFSEVTGPALLLDGLYRTDIVLTPGDNVLTFSAGDGSEVTLRIPVKETTAPVVSILGDYNCIIPACQTSLAHIINVQIDDICEVGFDPDRLTFKLNNQVLEPEEVDELNGIARYRLTLTTQNNGNIIRADYTDAAGNAGSFSTPINVVQALENMPPQLIAADATLGLPECFAELDLNYSIQLIDDCEPIDPSAFSFSSTGLLPDSDGTLDYVVDIDPDFPTRATVRFTGNLAPDTYTLTFDYLTASQSQTILVNAIPNQAPEIVMPGNLNLTLPPCQVQVPARFAIKLTDDCDPLELDRVSITLGGIPLTAVKVNAEYVQVDVMLSAAMNGIELRATYEDESGLTTTRSVPLNILSEPDDIAPVIIYPTLNLDYEIDPCDIGGTAMVSFEVSAIDNCLGPVEPTVLINGGAVTVITQNSVGGNTYLAALAPGTYTVSISATDGSNTRDESFTITVTQDPAPLFQVACQGDLSLTLGADCQSTLTPQMLLSGELGCLDLENDLRIIVQDGNPANGPSIDGCGTFDYEIRPVIPEPAEDFTGAFAPGNWILNTNDSALDIGFFGNELRFANPTVPAGSDGVTARAAVLAPANGSLSFDWSFSSNEAPFGLVYELFAFILDANGEATKVVLSNNITVGADGVASGTINDLALEAGELFVLSLEVDAFSPVGAQAIVSNWTFDAEPSPFLNNFIGCDGQVTTKDLSAPLATAPADTDVNLNNGVPLYCDQTDALNILSIPLAQRCYRTNAAGVTIPGTMVPALRAILNITGIPTVSDNCGTVEVCVSDQVISDEECEDIQLRRTFRVRDRIDGPCPGPGETVTVSQIITFSRPTIEDLELPQQVVQLSCGFTYVTLPNGNPIPEYTGFPTLMTGVGPVTLSPTFCNLSATFVDQPVVEVCENTISFVRTWSIYDECNLGEIRTINQLIEIGDMTPPLIGDELFVDQNQDGIADPEPYNFTTNAFECSGVFLVPLPEITDDCSADFDVIAYIYPFGDLDASPFGPYAANTPTDALPKGQHTLVYEATDNCGNTSTASFEIMIVDRTAPIAKCTDKFIVSLGGNGTAQQSADQIDGGSYDECTDVRLEVRRRLPDGGYSDWAETVLFDCEDIGNTILIELRVWDDGNMDGILGGPNNAMGSDNSNFCWMEIQVENQQPAICLPPPPTSRTCVEVATTLPQDLVAAYTADPDAITSLLDELFGAPTALTNCNTAEIEELNPIDSRDDCGFGPIIRRFRTRNPDAENTSPSVCTQTIQITEVHEYKIGFPADVASADCELEMSDDLITIETGCDLLSVYVDDQLFEAAGDACYKIKRTYEVINWCEYPGEEAEFIEIGRDEDNDNIPGEAVWVTVADEVARVRRNENSGTLRTLPNYANLPNRGAWRYVQYLKVYDNTAPQLTVGLPEPFCSTNAACTATGTFEVSVTDGCNLESIAVTATFDGFVIDSNEDGNITAAEFNSDGEVIVTGSAPNFTLSGSFPIGRHALRVVATDGCGNSSAEIIVFEVLDCKAPAMYCISEYSVPLVQMATGGMAMLDVDEIGASAEDACSSPVELAIYRTADVLAAGDSFVPDPDVDQLQLTCADLGEIAVRIYAIDAAGNYDYCEIMLDVQDPSSLCAGGAGIGIVTGAIQTEVGYPVEGVEVSLSNYMQAATVTSMYGSYTFESLPEDEDYTVTPYSNNDPANGVSTFDIVLIQKHILGVQMLDSPYKIIAADANDSQSISTLDLIHIRRLILGTASEFPNNTSWRFVEADYLFPQDDNPWQEDFPEIRNANNLVGTLGADFVAVKIGDVNTTAVANSQMSAADRNFAGSLDFLLPELDLERGQTYRVPVRARNMDEVQGYQFTLAAQSRLVSLLDIEPGMIGLDYFGPHFTTNNLLTNSWHWAGQSYWNQDMVLFTLVLRAEDTGRLSEALTLTDVPTQAEAYDLGGGLIRPELNFATGLETHSSLILYQNFPNPFRATTTIGFELPSPQPVRLFLTDQAGRVVFQAALEGRAGYNRIDLDRQQLRGASGVLYYTLETPLERRTRKMLIAQ